MTGFTTDGVYNVRNVGRDLMLDLLGNNPFEGATIQGWGRNGTQAQEVCMTCVLTHLVILTYPINSGSSGLRAREVALLVLLEQSPSSATIATPWAMDSLLRARK